MKGVVGDTHSVLWYLFDNPALSRFATDGARIGFALDHPRREDSQCWDSNDLVSFAV
jgi:hypothetical protein